VSGVKTVLTTIILGLNGVFWDMLAQIIGLIGPYLFNYFIFLQPKSDQRKFINETGPNPYFSY